MIRIIVLNPNGRSWLKPCLQALRARRFQDFEVVVDNGSTDGSIEYVARFRNAVLALDSNAGFAVGNSAGGKGATRPCVVFLNNDTVADAGWLEALVARAEGHPTAGLVASAIVFPNWSDIVDSARDGYLRCCGAFKRRHGQGLWTAPPSSSRAPPTWRMVPSECLMA